MDVIEYATIKIKGILLPCTEATGSVVDVWVQMQICTCLVLYFPFQINDSYIYNYIIRMTFKMCISLTHFMNKSYSGLK